MRNKTTTLFLNAYEQATRNIDLKNKDIQQQEIYIEDRSFKFQFVHRECQNYQEVRRYRRTILESMGLPSDSPAIQVIGDSDSFGEKQEDFARQFLFDVLDRTPNHIILYGLTGKLKDTNAIINEWVANDTQKQARVIGNAVSTHTPIAINNWDCEAGDIRTITVVYPDAVFGDDVQLSDYFVPQFDNKPGESFGICLEGGLFSLLQSIQMLYQNVPIYAVENLRASTNPTYNFFSATEFLNLIKLTRLNINAEGLEVTPKDIEMIRNTYIYDPTRHGPYDPKNPKGLRVFCNPTNQADYATKMVLFDRIFAQLISCRIWGKLELFNHINCEQEVLLEKQVIDTSLSLYSAMAKRDVATLNEVEECASASCRSLEVYEQKKEIALAAIQTKLKHMNRTYCLQLSEQKIFSICNDIITFFSEIKNKVETYSFLNQSVNSKISWSPHYQTIVDEMKDKFVYITSAVGKISPGILPGVFWNGSASLVAAKKFGCPTQKTLPIKLIDSIFFNELKDAFFPNLVEKIQDAAVAYFYWVLVSSIYTSNLTGNVNLYSIESTIQSNSIFWNFELPLIRRSGLNIKMNLLKDSACKRFQELSRTLDKSPVIEAEIEQLLTTSDNWINSNFEDRLKITAGTKPDVRYATLSNCIRKWRKHSMFPSQTAVEPDASSLPTIILD